jgi:replicative DNA helicase
MQAVREYVDSFREESLRESALYNFTAEIMSEGIPQEVAEAILSKDLEGKEVREIVDWLKPLVAKGYTEDVLRLAVNCRKHISLEQLDGIQKTVNVGTNVIVAYLAQKGAVTVSEAESLHNLYEAIENANNRDSLSKGDEGYQNPEKIVSDAYEEIARKKLSRYNKVKMDEATGVAVWHN